MFSNARTKFLKNPVFICSSFLTRIDRKKIIFFSIVQSILGLVDVVGISLLGVLGSLTISGVQSRKPSGVISRILEFLGVENQDFQIQVAIIAILAVVILASKTFLTVFLTKRVLYFFSTKSASLSSYLVERLLTGSLNAIQMRNPQDVIYSVTSGVSSMNVGVLGSAVTMISDAFLLILIFLGLLYINPLLAIGMTLYFGLVAIFLYSKLHNQARGIGERSAKLQISTNKKLLEALDSFREIYVRNREYFYVETYAKSRNEFAKLESEQAFFPNISKYAMEMSILIGALLLSAALFISTDATEAAGVLALFMAAGMRTAPAILRLQQGLLNIKMQFGLALPTIQSIQSIPLDKLPSSGKLQFQNSGNQNFNGEVEIADLCFRYPGSKEYVLQNFDLKIDAGTTFAIVGPSAAGKSTLIDCILGLQIPTEGSVFISGRNPREAIELWPGRIGYVPQQVNLFEGTIAQNIALGFSDEDIDEKSILNALESVALLEFVKSLENGIHTNIGERGSTLSGGQNNEWALRVHCTHHQEYWS